MIFTGSIVSLRYSVAIDMLRSAVAPILRGRGFHATGARFGLLKGLNPLLTADLLHVLRSAGHG